MLKMLTSNVCPGKTKWELKSVKVKVWNEYYSKVPLLRQPSQTNSSPYSELVRQTNSSPYSELVRQTNSSPYSELVRQTNSSPYSELVFITRTKEWYEMIETKSI